MIIFRGQKPANKRVKMNEVKEYKTKKLEDETLKLVFVSAGLTKFNAFKLVVDLKPKTTKNDNT